MSLSLDRRISRALISTPSRLAGELDARDLLLRPTFPTDRIEVQTSFTAGPYSRNYYLLSFKVPDDLNWSGSFAVPVTTTTNATIPHYDEVVKMLIDLASIWFGKRFDYHGFIVATGRAFVPDLSSVSPSSHYQLGPYNREPRPDLNIKLEWQCLSPISELLYQHEPEKPLIAFRTASRFYARALRAYETDPEVAFLHFIVALEIIASQLDIPDDDLYDEQARQDLAAIESKLGRKLASRVRQRYFQLKRKVIYAARTLVNDAFYEGSQAKSHSRLDPSKLEGCIKAMYDLRSNYVHAGTPFGVWFDLYVEPADEIQTGTPVLPGQQKGLERILANIPTFVGLERLVRFIILRFAHQQIRNLHSKLE